MEYLGRTDFVQVKPTGIQRNRAEQMARIAEELTKQQPLELPDLNDNAKPIETKKQLVIPSVGETPAVDDGGANKMLSGMMGDAPPCGTCGHITIRNGSCYKCLNCGSTTGCS